MYFISAIFVLVYSLNIYYDSGVIRDVPELGISLSNVHAHMHSEYVDAPYYLDKEFTDDTKTHVFILGDSFSRDFANIIMESSVQNKVEISYRYGFDTCDVIDRIKKADYVFLQ